MAPDFWCKFFGCQKLVNLNVAKDLSYNERLERIELPTLKYARKMTTDKVQITYAKLSQLCVLHSFTQQQLIAFMYYRMLL